MMEQRAASRLRQVSTPSVGAVGAAGGGTLLVLVANQLPENSKLKPWLLLIAPSMTLTFGIVWFWLQAIVVDMLHDWQLRRAFQRAKSTLEDALKNPATSDTHKDHIRREIEGLEKMIIAQEKDRITALRLLSTHDARSAAGLNERPRVGSVDPTAKER